VLRHELSDLRHLRPFEESDADELFAVVDANRTYLSRWLPWVGSARDAGYSLEWIRRTREQLADNSGLQLAIIDAGAIVGVVGLWAIDANRSATVGYWIAEDQQGRGLVSEALAALIAHAFGPLRLNRLELRAAVDNERSKAIAERLGFTLDGTLRGAERHGDRFVDVAVYSLTAPLSKHDSQED
jgi:ribosomal-protein-serine acetyltransferase